MMGYGWLLRDGSRGPGGRLLRAIQPTLEESWDRQAEALRRLGLLRSGERARVEGR